ncbi:MAG: glycoside hydrolase family 1 protein [Alphaproteobacteria bacterium]|nr:glycoside hydrolase family 1 protein [Alphaproteobacteria bacterium]
MALISLLLLACTGPDVAGGDSAAPAGRAFPDGFSWGASMAGFQVDPGCPTLPAGQCEDPHSDWYVWVTDPDLIAEPGNHLSGQPLSDGPGHWELYGADFARARDELHLGSLRNSIEWSRLFPDDPGDVQTVDELAAYADPDAVAAYHAYFSAMRDAGLEPMVTLNHYTIPTWLHDAKGCHEDLSTCEDRGWLDGERFLKHIELYAGFCAREYGEEIDLWLTLNEPLAVVLSGYLMPSEDRTNPPGVIDPDAAFAVMLAQIEAHARMYDAIHAWDDTAQVGAAPNLAAVAPKVPGDADDELGVEHFDYLYNRVFLNGTVRGEWDPDLDGVVDEVREDLIGRTDFVGVNYYTQITVDGLGFPVFGSVPIFDFLPVGGFWTSYPQGLTEVLDIADDYGLPIYITENGTSTWDVDATDAFLLPHLSALADAIDAGADVRGYYYWSLLDNYEWNHGMAMEFGLYDVDSTTKTRTARPMALDYAEIARTNALPAE